MSYYFPPVTIFAEGPRFVTQFLHSGFQLALLAKTLSVEK